MKRILLISIPILLAALFAIWWFSPEKVMKRRIEAMLTTAEVPTSMSDVGRSARGPNLAEFLAEQVTFRPPEDFDHPFDEFVTREGAAAMYSAVARGCREITFTDLEFDEITIDNDTVSADFRVDTLVELSSRRPIDGILVVKSQWTKTEEGWLLVDFSWQETGR